MLEPLLLSDIAVARIPRSSCVGFLRRGVARDIPSAAIEKKNCPRGRYELASVDAQRALY